MHFVVKRSAVFFNISGAAYFLSGFNANDATMFGKNYPERFHSGVKIMV